MNSCHRNYVPENDAGFYFLASIKKTTRNVLKIDQDMIGVQLKAFIVSEVWPLTSRQPFQMIFTSFAKKNDQLWSPFESLYPFFIVSVSSKMDLKRNLIQSQQDQIQMLKSEVNERKAEKLQLSSDMQKQQQLEEQCVESTTEIQTLTRDIRVKRQLSSLDWLFLMFHPCNNS